MCLCFRHFIQRQRHQVLRCQALQGMFGDVLEVVEVGEETCQHHRYKIHRAGNSVCLHGGEVITGSLEFALC